MTKKCQICNEPPKVTKDYTSCQNEKCPDFEAQYLHFEWSMQIKDLAELKRLEL